MALKPWNINTKISKILLFLPLANISFTLLVKLYSSREENQLLGIPLFYQLFESCLKFRNNRVFLEHIPDKAHNKTCPIPSFSRIALLSGKIISSWEANPQFILELEFYFSWIFWYCFNFVKAWNRTLLSVINNSLST